MLGDCRLKLIDESLIINGFCCHVSEFMTLSRCLQDHPGMPHQKSPSAQHGAQASRQSTPRGLVEVRALPREHTHKLYYGYKSLLWNAILNHIARAMWFKNVSHNNIDSHDGILTIWRTSTTKFYYGCCMMMHISWACTYQNNFVTFRLLFNPNSHPLDKLISWWWFPCRKNTEYTRLSLWFS